MSAINSAVTFVTQSDLTIRGDVQCEEKHPVEKSAFYALNFQPCFSSYACTPRRSITVFSHPLYDMNSMYLNLQSTSTPLFYNTVKSSILFEPIGGVKIATCQMSAKTKLYTRKKPLFPVHSFVLKIRRLTMFSWITNIRKLPQGNFQSKN